jgi:hypothetical protein
MLIHLLRGAIILFGAFLFIQIAPILLVLI